GMKVVIREYQTIDAESMIRFLKDLEQESSADWIHIVLDNGASNRNRKLEEFLKTSRIHLHYLPPYSPNLNPSQVIHLNPIKLS
ncbi:MAG: transposase, partial [Anaerolineae bacterium]